MPLGQPSCSVGAEYAHDYLSPYPGHKNWVSTGNRLIFVSGSYPVYST